MRGSDDDGVSSGDEEVNRFYRTDRTGFTFDGHLANRALEDMSWLNRTQHSYEQDDDEEHEDEQHEHHEDEYEPPYSLQGAPEPTSAPFQPNVSQPAPPTPQIQVSHAPPSSQPCYSEHFPEAYTHATSQEDLEFPAGMYFGSTPYCQPSEDPARPGMPEQLSPYASVAVEASPSVQPPTPAPDLPRHMEYGGTAQQKRARKSTSTPSSSGHHRRHRKHHHASEQHGYGSQGPSVPQGIPQTQQPPMQGTHRDEGLLGISHFGPGGQVLPQGRGSAYGHPDPHRRANAADVERISHAYASQQMPELRPNPFAGMQRSAPSSYVSGAGPGYGAPPQGESSSQGAGRSQLYPAQPVGPHAHFSHMSGPGRSTGRPQDQAMQNVGPSTASIPQSQGIQSHGQSSGQGASHSQAFLPQEPYMAPLNVGGGVDEPPPPPPQISDPGPTRDMNANALWAFMSAAGPRSSLRFRWTGVVFEVSGATSKPQKWSDAEVNELKVIIASFEDWQEVEAMGQRTPGGRGLSACFQQARQKVRPWSAEEDADVRSLTSADPRVRMEIVERLFWQEREGDEIVGRFNLFKRSSSMLNLGNQPHRGLTEIARSKKDKRRS